MYLVNGIKLLQYYTENRLYTSNTVLYELVNDGAIINQSTDCNVTVNDVVLVPGQEYGFGGNFGEVNLQTYTITFIPTGVSPVQQVAVLLKKYKNVV